MNQTLEWNQHVDKVQSKVYGALAFLRFHRRSLSFSLKTQLIESLVIPHFDYASVGYMHVDKTRGLDLKIAHNACIRFIYGYVPFIPTDDINTHLTQVRLKLGWLSLASRRHLQLINLFYKVVCNPDLDYLCQLFKITENNALVSQSTRLPPRAFDYKSPRTKAWNSSYTIEGQRLANRLSIISFDANRLRELKAWVYNLFFQAEKDAWRLRVEREGFGPRHELTCIPSPPLPLYGAAFTPPGLNLYLNNPERKLEIPFTDSLSETPFSQT